MNALLRFVQDLYPDASNDELLTLWTGDIDRHIKYSEDRAAAQASNNYGPFTDNEE